jgi:hypothetical protein
MYRVSIRIREFLVLWLVGLFVIRDFVLWSEAIAFIIRIDGIGEKGWFFSVIFFSIFRVMWRGLFIFWRGVI